MTECRPAGYLAIAEQLGLKVIMNWHRSRVHSNPGAHRITESGGVVEEVYPSRYWPGDSIQDHLEFALKYDGINLGILSALFTVFPQADVLDFVQEKPTGKYARSIWFLYEMLTGIRLPLEDLSQGNYFDLLDPEKNVTISPAQKVRRQRVNNNLLGNTQFCPTIRKTAIVSKINEEDIRLRCQQTMSVFDPVIFRRALNYLYTKETKSSFEIERIEPSSERSERFIALLQLAEKEDFCTKEKLVELQNRVVDSRYACTDYRNFQNYVGESLPWRKERIHFVSPKPDDVTSLMRGLMAAHGRMEQGDVQVVAHAAAIAYGFVFIHPFDDGNGRIHRFLIHNIFARHDLTPEGLMFPISASMLKQPREYDDSLEAFSNQVMPFIDYQIDDNGALAVKNDTAHWYRYIDMTVQVEKLSHFVDECINRILLEELQFLASYDKTKKAIQQVVDMPDQKIDLFIKLCLQNGYKLSERKHASHFGLLTDEEISRLEAVVKAGYESAPKPGKNESN